jgi:hypothetical protein
METFIVVLEYRGAVLLAGVAADRVPVCEHAYDLDTGALAGHPAGDSPQVGFPVCQRGWNTPPQSARCADCDIAVQRAVGDLIAAAIYLITGRRPRRGPGPPAPQDPGGS